MLEVTQPVKSAYLIIMKRKSEDLFERNYHRIHDLGIARVFKMPQQIPPHIAGLVERTAREQFAEDRRHRGNAVKAQLSSDFIVPQPVGKLTTHDEPETL